jgi:Zn-dependent peptidase ImmA (M78 family)
MASIPAYVEPSLLTWARTSANLERVAAERKLNLPPGRIEEWETGERRPTIAELRKAATVYNRSLAVFFLPEPPSGFETLRDFRRLDLAHYGEWSAALHAEYRRAHLQRDALLEIREVDDVQVQTHWRIEHLPANDGALSKAIRKNLRGIAPMAYPDNASDEYSHLNYWISTIEEAGVLVMATAGGRVSTEEMRAFSLYFEDTPVIVLNGSDWPRGRLFSLLHEYVHLVLHTAGLCDTTTDTKAVTADRRLESRCNAVAAEVLMPTREFQQLQVVTEHAPGSAWTLDELLEGSRHFGTSVESFLRRLVTLGLASLESYQYFRANNREIDLRGRRSGSGNYYNNKVRDLGKGYVRQVTDAYRRAVIDTTTTATFLDAKVSQIPELARRAQLRRVK